MSDYRPIRRRYSAQKWGRVGAVYFPKCQNLSQKILFTATKQFCVKNGCFGPSFYSRPMKNQCEEGQNLHTSPAFVHVFCSNFATFRVFVSTPNFQKSTPNFSAALTFFFSAKADFCEF